MNLKEISNNNNVVFIYRQGSSYFYKNIVIRETWFRSYFLFIEFITFDKPFKY